LPNAAVAAWWVQEIRGGGDNCSSLLKGI